MKRSKGRADSLSPVQDGCLPEFWVARKSKSRGGKTYYFNTFTGLSSWRHPGKFGVDQVWLPYTAGTCDNQMAINMIQSI